MTEVYMVEAIKHTILQKINFFVIFWQVMSCAVPMFSVSYKAKNSNFHKYFRNIPQSERLLEDYACALVKDILIQGRIYISQNWICFHANILSWETTLQIPVSKVREVKKNEHY